MNDISILIVEDEPQVLARLSHYLSIFFNTIYEARNGLEAFELYNKYRPDIILTDINMPDLRGVDFIENVRKVNLDIPIIVLSAQENTQDFLRLVSLNLLSYLTKPIQMQELKKNILKAIEKIKTNKTIFLNNEYAWNIKTKDLYKNNNKIELTRYESAFLEILISKINQNVSYEEIHNYIYSLENYSLNAIFTIVKRLRKKTSKDFIKSVYKFGYIIKK